jgi:two-component system response regulator NreC
MLRKIRILLADDHPVVRQGFKLIINQEPDMEVVGEASEGAEIVRLTQQLRPQVVIMDIAMPQVNGVEATRRITENHPESKVIILSMHKDAVYVRESLRAGAKGYLLKDSIDNDLLRAIRAVADVHGYLSPEVSSTVLEGGESRKGNRHRVGHQHLYGGRAPRPHYEKAGPAQFHRYRAIRHAQRPDRMSGRS